MKGQISVEMLIVVGLGMLIVSIYILYGYASIDSYKKGNDQFLLKDSLEKIATTAKFVALQGEPAKQTVNVCFPMSLETCSVYNTTLQCSLRTGEYIYQDSEVVLNGTMPGISGCWNIVVEANPAFVNLSIS
ncbi:MAG: hypothetical protein JW727_04390 [Candidatus Aenigmarchaeota archaeon]|nr:hypothetical protein [Candidatus Aenigmarchaeota archaeon]